MNTHDIDIELPPLVGTLAALPERHRNVIEAYGQACARVAIEADRKRRREPTAAEISDVVREITGCPDIKSGEKSLVVALEMLFHSCAAPQPAEPVGEVLGETCIDGGKCHHGCKERCFRRQYCDPFSDYSGPWKYADEPGSPQPAEPIVSDVEAIVRLLESREWAEHVATTPLGQRLETAVTVLVGAVPQPAEPDLAKCAECGAEMIHVRPGKWQHPDCSQSSWAAEPVKVEPVGYFYPWELERSLKVYPNGFPGAVAVYAHPQPAEPVKVPNALPSGTNYSVEPHGNGYAIYQGRDGLHHGANLAHLTECTPEFSKRIESALNAMSGPVSKTDWNNELSSWSDEDFIRIFHERPDLANRLRNMLAEPVEGAQ